jgi:ATP-binding cassette subfamily F protein uup
VLLARGVSHGYGESLLVRNFEIIMQRGMRAGIVGPNGCGKTTLLRLLMGLEEPRRGKVVIGETTSFLYVDQAHEDANPEQTVLDFVSNGQRFWDVGQRRIFVPSYLEKFLFDQKAVSAPMGNLSGGERNRLDIARKLLRGGNFLVLDEPTNDLDLYTLRVLEEAIIDFDGCALIVSHDRYFLNRVCTHMWVFEDGGDLVQITGNYDDVLLFRERRAAAEKEAAAANAAGSKAGKGRDANKSAAPRRLTYMEQKELAEIESRVTDAESEVTRLEGLVSSPDFYKRPPEEIKAALDALEQARAQVNAVYARWQELESRA